MDRAVRSTIGNQSQLNKLLQSGDVSQAVQLAKAAIVAVDFDERIPQNQLIEKRKAVRVHRSFKETNKTKAHTLPTARERFSVLDEQGRH